MKAKHVFLFVLGLYMVLAVFLLVHYGEYLYPERAIRQQILKMMPLGTKRAEVEKFIKLKGYKIRTVATNGFSSRDRRDEAIGSSYIRTVTFDKKFLNITVYWIFDERNLLVEINVWKDIDLL